MKLKKWNYKKHEYEDYEVPNTYRCKVYSTDMDSIVDCPSCGTAIKFSQAYISNEIHTEFGMGYAVCPSCYKEELERRKSSRDDEER